MSFTIKDSIEFHKHVFNQYIVAMHLILGFHGCVCFTVLSSAPSLPTKWTSTSLSRPGANVTCSARPALAPGFLLPA